MLIQAFTISTKVNVSDKVEIRTPFAGYVFLDDNRLRDWQRLGFIFFVSTSFQ